MYKISKKQLLVLVYAAIIIIGGFIPCVYASSTLEGTPETQSGATVYKAVVKPEDETVYSMVYGVNGDNTDYSNYGEVFINKGVVTGTVYGARAISGRDYVHASNNSVDITDSTIANVYGGYAYGGSGDAAVHANKVKINGGVISGYVYGGSSDGSTISVSGNEVYINNAQIDRTVYGGCAFNTSSWLSMLRNKVVIENSTVKGSVYGGYASGNAAASNSNTVTIGTGTVISKGHVYGGYSLSDNSDAKNNIVIIKGGTVNGYVYGGVGRNACNNIVAVKGGNLTNAYLKGYSDGRKSHYGNSLEVWSSDIEVKSVGNFENYFFLIPEGIVNQKDRYMLKVEIPVNLNDTAVGIAVQNGVELHVDDKINLIDNTEGSPSLVSLEGKTLSANTSLYQYGFCLTSVDNSLIATVTSEERIPLSLLLLSEDTARKAASKAKALTEGQVASVALLGKGGDLAIGAALSDAESAVLKAHSDGKTWATFITVDYGKSDYSKESHISLSNTDLIAGLAKSFSSSDTENLVGIYFETGNGNYSTFNSFEYGSVFGEGSADYFGGGLMFRLEPSEKKGLYIQGLGRIGGVNNSWNTDDLFEEKVSYGTNHLYYGVAAGVGYQNKVWNKVCYDVQGTFMFTHQNSDGEFISIDSLKTQIGLKIAYDGFKAVRPLVGITWEKEFDALDIKGNSGILELGVTSKPDSNANWHFDVVAAGSIGVRREIRGSVLFSVSLN